MPLLCMMAKAPIAGAVKTRMCPPLTTDRAAELAHAFIIDSWTAMHQVADMRCVLVHAGDLNDFPDVLTNADAWPQARGDLGQRMAAVLETGLRRDDVVLIVGSDSPGLPARLIVEAVRALDNHDVVLGPSDDGGYYLLGSRRWSAAMLDNLPWSSEDTLAATTARFGELGWSVKHITCWFDVDDATGLRRLSQAINNGEITATATRSLLEQWQWR